MRIFWPTAESREQFDRVTLEKELESMHKFGALGVSDNAIYVSSFFRDGIIGVHPNTNTATVFLKATDLVRVLQENGTDISFMEL